MYRDEVVLKSVFRDHFERILDRYYRFTPRVVWKMDESSLYEKFVKYFLAYPFVFFAERAASTALIIRGLKVFDAGMHIRTGFNR